MRFLLFAVLACMSCSGIQAQSLNGIIKDETDHPVSNAQILNIRTGIHTHSNEEGTFVLQELELGDTLEISHLQFIDKYVAIDSLASPIVVILIENIISLDEVVISPELSALNIITEIDLQTNPVGSSQEILQQVPGLIIGQHAGGGKAEQIFLRGFDLDHGTDINIQVDGIPVNMVSHAHGQGYADLHFLIPEIVEKIDFGKGPYYADKGNFNTAGYVNFKTKKRLENSLIKTEVGQFNSNRLIGLLKFTDNEGSSSYAAMEYLSGDGPFDSPQNLNRLNLFGKYSSSITQTDRIGLTLSHFWSKWDASGQIPQRAVDRGLIGRFGAIDDTEGGFTSRTNIILNYDKFINDNTIITNQLFYSIYEFELFSNFTFYLEDPIHGDQIKQRENRNIAGWNSEYKKTFSNDWLKGHWSIGLEIRNDRIENNELSHTINRKEVINPIQNGDVNETNVGAYLNLSLNYGPWTINPGLRIDHLNFQYNDALITNYQTQTASKSIVSPKLNILFNQTDQLQFYLKAGTGFHSNDTRVVVAQNGKQILPAAYGSDVGFLWKPMSRLLVNAAYWFLFLDQEFVYVGDAGIVEPSGKTRRQGVDLSLRYQPVERLFLDLDANYAHARARGEARGEDYIPLAPEFTLTGGLTYLHNTGFYGSTRIRHMQDRPANEDNTIIAEGYTLIDLNLGYEWKQFNIGMSIQNLFDTEWKETQFATLSRLKDEETAVEENHFIPGTPFYIKGIFEFKF